MCIEPYFRLKNYESCPKNEVTFYSLLNSAFMVKNTIISSTELV